MKDASGLLQGQAAAVDITGGKTTHYQLAFSQQEEARLCRVWSILQRYVNGRRIFQAEKNIGFIN